MTYSNATPANAAYLASRTGLDPSVALAWLKLEGQSVPNPSNPLNIRSSPLQTGTTPGGGFATFPSTQVGLDAAARLIANSSNYAGIRAAIRGGSPQAQAIAIEESPWAAGHYGYTAIERALGVTPAAPRPAPRVSVPAAPKAAAPAKPTVTANHPIVAYSLLALAVVAFVKLAVLL